MLCEKMLEGGTEFLVMSYWREMARSGASLAYQMFLLRRGALALKHNMYAISSLEWYGRPNAFLCGK